MGNLVEQLFYRFENKLNVRVYMVLKGMSEKDEVERILILIINGIKRKTGKFY